MPEIAFEDLIPGTTTTFGGMPVTAEAISDFARDYDAQPFHLSEDLAKGTFVGRQIASGWHTLALQMRMLADEWLLRSTGMGSPGIDEVRWLKPVLPGDVLRVRQTILDARPSASRPWMGVVRFRFETLNDRDDVVMTQTNAILFGLRDGPPEPAPSRRPPQAPQDGGFAALKPPSGGRPQMIRPFEELEVGATDFLGEHRFERDDIVRFARAFDPQPFHVDEEAAARSHFGRLAASGWQTAATWMRHLVRLRSAASDEARAAGHELPRFGPSPGFTDLRWLRPVHAGDTIRFATTLVSKRPSGTRPGWGLTFSHNTGWNGEGEKVFEFSGGGFVGMRARA